MGAMARADVKVPPKIRPLMGNPTTIESSVHLIRASKDHINIRILEIMLSGMPFILVFGTRI